MSRRVGTQASVQKNKLLAIVVKTYAKLRHQIFLVLSNFACFSYFLPNILSLIEDQLNNNGLMQHCRNVTKLKINGLDEQFRVP